MSDMVNCARCGDYKGDDWSCPDCGAEDSHEPVTVSAETRRPTKARSAGSIVGALLILTAALLVLAPAAGLLGKISWRLICFGWGLVP